MAVGGQGGEGAGMAAERPTLGVLLVLDVALLLVLAGLAKNKLQLRPVRRTPPRGHGRRLDF
jgi:hypothetical protein